MDFYGSTIFIEVMCFDHDEFPAVSMMIISLIITGLVIFLVYDWIRPGNSDDRSRPGKFYLSKYLIFRILLWLNASKQKRNQSSPDNIPRDDSRARLRGYGYTVTDPLVLENCIPLEDDPFAIDTTYFNGFSRDGISVALRVARKGHREGEVWVLLDIPGTGFFQHPLHPDTGVINMDGGSFLAGGCRFEMLEPMTRWKVSYNGLLRKGLYTKLDNKPEEYLNVKLSFKWECINDPFNFDTDCDRNLLADAIARERWTREFWKKLRGKHQTHYEQVGELSGKIDIEGYPSQKVHLIGVRDHTFGFRNWEMFHRYAVHYIWVPEIGTLAMVCVLWMPDYISFMKTGFLSYANGETFPVQDVDFDLVNLTKDKYPPDSYSFMFKAGNLTYSVQMQSVVTPELYHYKSRKSRILERFCVYTVNNMAARGMVEYHYRNPEGPPMLTAPPTSVPILVEPTTSEIKMADREITLPFTERVCCSSELVGGKGSQLAFLTSIQDKVRGIVPTGFCVTLYAFDRQVLDTDDINQAITKICEAARYLIQYGIFYPRAPSSVEDLQRYCVDAVDLLAGCKVVEPIEMSVTNQLKLLYPQSYNTLPLAVRSSTAGEDGGEASSAGQMETYLGVCGVDKVLEAVRKCWASAYTYQAVEYRRQHGQQIRTAVGVVIQEMVQSDVSGVLFTNDPITGSPNRMIIDASFGLGEVVVSGKTTPDTYTVQRLYDNHLTVVDRHLGDKNLQIHVSDTGGTKETETKGVDSERLCLTDSQVLKLCETAIKIEEYYGTSRDVEWAMRGEEIYLLQARPITTIDQETEEDLIHEFDSSLVTGNERITQGNIGEMMPGCVTPLTNSLFRKAIDYGTCAFLIALGGGRIIKYASKSICIFCGRLFLNMTLIAQISSNSIVFKKEALETNLLGEILYDHTLEKIQSYGFQNWSFLSRLLRLLRFFFESKQRVKIADSWDKKLKTYKVGPQCTTAKDLYDEIQRKLPDYVEVWETTIMKSSHSGSMSALVMGIISGGNNVWTVENYSDVALLLAHCQDVYSVEVPTALQDMARLICQLGFEEEFQNMTEKECVAYITSDQCSNELSLKYQVFMDHHGHRCVREAEFIEKSWESEPEKLIKVLKAIIKSKAYNVNKKETLSLNEAIRRLKSPVSAIGKFLLRKWIVPKTRNAVGQREFGKSVSVKMADKFKQAFWRLSGLLEQEGRIPDRELMFFMTNSEIGHLLQNRSSRIITRAVRRRRIFPLQSAMEFPRLTIGRPQPKIRAYEEEQRETTFTLSGMPVSQGSVKGTVRVVKSLEDASAIQTGDILVVKYTDVGWSPYFPLISGLVTEMGGLISHGAVVAREYGLPCVVNVPKATDILKTGDFVFLEGANGKIHKLEDNEKL